MTFPIEGAETVQSIMAGPKPQKEVKYCEHREFDRGPGLPYLADQIGDQDLELAENIQAGKHSRGY